jgi:hypothetical protein
MRIQWEPLKNEWLKNHRGVSFEPICEKISKGDILGVFANPSPKYPHQGVFVLEINDYTWVVPFRDSGD